ncbi:MAG: site-2 protease family protein [Ilumatobacteraceae bacterium]|jgi:membrane-associated protease RseP (regulator of RpoE activity)|nr:site-2 protease family protein [Ilumatobacteraceae bacterium]
MSDFYQRFRSEMAAGGAVGGEADPKATRQGHLAGILVLALLSWLAVKNPWTFVFVVGLLISIFLHEVGHFVTARRSSMLVTQFFMGFGPRVWSIRRNEVEYGIRALPLGAFVRIVGMNNLDEVDVADESRTYRAQSYPKRMLVITAGSVMHLLIALTLFVAVYSFAGRIQETGKVAVMQLVEGETPARSAGIVQDDVIESFNNVRVYERSDLIEQIVATSPGDRVEVTYRHDKEQRTATVTMIQNPANPEIAYFGVGAWSRDYVKLSPPTAVWQSFRDMVSDVGMSVKGVVTVLNPVNSVEHLTNEDADINTRPSTVVGASQMGGTVGRQEGLKGVILMLASINVFVGVFNMLPLLPFDGGHAAIATYERLRSRRGKVYRADISKMIPVATTVVALLALLLFTGLYLDITRPMGG